MKRGEASPSLHSWLSLRPSHKITGFQPCAKPRTIRKRSMNDDALFRRLLLIGFLILFPIGLWHRVRADTKEPLDRSQEGWFILVALRVAGGLGGLGVVAWLINPAWLAWTAVRLPAGVRWAGIGLGVAAGLLFLWTLRSLGKNLTDTVVTRREHTLVTHGPYRWMRHPFYTSGALATPASFLATANWFFLILGCVVLALLVTRTRKEEENLIKRFGDDYRRYMERTGRFWPR